MSRMMLSTPSLPWQWIPHSCLVTMATSAVPPTWNVLDQKPLPSPWVPFEPSPSLGGCQIQWIILMTGSRYRWTRKEGTLIGRKSLKLFTGTDWKVTSELPMPYNMPSDKLQPFRLPFAQEEASGWQEAPHSLSALHHWNFYPKLIPSAWGTSMLLDRRKLWH